MGHEPRNLRLIQTQCPGDVAVLTAAVRDLMQQYPGRYILDYHGFHGPERPHLKNQEGNNIFAHNPLLTPLGEGEGREIICDYNYGIQRPDRMHFIEAFHKSLGHKLGVNIEVSAIKPDIYLSMEERELFPGLPERYGIVDAGKKADFTAKWSGTYKYQQMVNATKDRITWVQIGSSGDFHPPLDGVINMVGKTNLRQLIQVIYRSSLVVTPVSLPMHLAAGVPTVDGKHRPCVVLMGRREQRSWEAFPYHTVLGTDGVLKCGEGLNGGCWRNKTVAIPGDRDNSICRLALQDEVGEWIPECLHNITVDELVHAVSLYL